MEQTNEKAITVYCASSPDAPEVFLRAAYDLGLELARVGFGTVTGAGRSGLMGEVVRGSLDGGAPAIGVIPQFMVDRGWANPLMTELHVTADMYERKRLLASRGCGAVALPGGLGTLDELMDLLTQCQLSLYHNPVVILNTDGFYDNLLAQLEHTDSCRMMRHFDLPGNLWQVARTPADAAKIFAGK